VTKLYLEDAELYDIAFDWDVTAEVAWLYELLGRPRSILEPGCGSGRMLAAFARLGVETTGIDLSPQMLELARARLGADAVLHTADMTDFDLGRVFDGAISPINTLLHLTPLELALHLERTAHHLVRGGAYLVQVGLMEPEPGASFAGSHWEASRGETVLHCSTRSQPTMEDRRRTSGHAWLARRPAACFGTSSGFRLSA
jgi:SAM-dependent methyltransferase